MRNIAYPASTPPQPAGVTVQKSFGSPDGQRLNAGPEQACLHVHFHERQVCTQQTLSVGWPQAVTYTEVALVVNRGKQRKLLQHIHELLHSRSGQKKGDAQHAQFWRAPTWLRVILCVHAGHSASSAHEAAPSRSQWRWRPPWSRGCGAWRSMQRPLERTRMRIPSPYHRLPDRSRTDSTCNPCLRMVL